MKSYLALLLTLLTFGAWAEVATFPGCPWETLKLERTKTAVFVKDAVGKVVCSLRGEPGGIALDDVCVKLETDGLVVDAGAAFKAGMVKLVLNSCGLDRKPLEGRDCSVKAKLNGPSGSELLLYYEGHGPEGIGHFYRSSKALPRGREREFALATAVPTGLNELHLRLDICRQPVGKPIRISSFRYAPEAELPVMTRKKAVKPELLFRADFDGTATASFAKGAAEPTEARGLTYAPGVTGQAVRISSQDKSLLEYAVKGNVDPDRGTVAMWVKREWDFAAANQPWRTLFAFPWTGDAAGDRVGSGALWFWFYGRTLRADQSDSEDLYKTCAVPADDRWIHLVYEWDEEGVRIFVNGKSRAGKSDGTSPMIEALRSAQLVLCERGEFKRFTVGCRGDRERIDGLVDDLRAYSAPLGAEAVKALWREHAPRDMKEPPRPDYAKLFAADGPNRFEKPSFAAGGIPGDLELIEEVKLDAASVERLKTGHRFNSVGRSSFKSLGGVPYFETDARAGTRAAFRFNVDTNAPLYCFEFDYPDDAKRTADLIVQPCKGSDYILQVGYAAGDEYPNTGRILTHRCLYWSHAPEVAVVLMTAREGAPAALSAIRLYRVKADGLPVAAVNEPKPNRDGWRRTVALYFEDPAIGYDFGLSEDWTATPKGVGDLIDRVAAEMKYTGENLFAYPGAWYHGLIGDDYMPRKHAPDFLRAWYEKFGKEGLGVVPTVNPNTMPVEDGLVTRETMSNGALHPSEIAIHDTGKPNWGRWHDTPPNFNFHHPNVRANIERIIDALVEQGKGYPAFKGVCMHMTRHCMLWFGDEISGYNDYTVKAFADACGVAVPFDRFAANPLRGKDYAEWLRANCWDRWIRWRCDIVTAFYVRMAKKLAAARPDLKLWLNSFVPANYEHPDFTKPDFMDQANRYCGLDGAALTKGASNIILCQTLVPADYRWRHPGAYRQPGARDHQRILDTLPGFYSLLKGADYPWVNQHDRYWESAIGRTGGSLSCDWMRECGWRVSTINPAGRHALRHFVLPLRYSDVLGLSKGGFLIGTYGMEEVLVPFVRAFRALPAVTMAETGRVGDVVARQADFDGRSYFYVVNTGKDETTVEVTFPAGTKDLVSGEAQSAVPEDLKLAPYEFRSYSAPAGKPNVR